MAKTVKVEAKLPVWVAMSDLFLDQEQQPEDYRRIAGILKASRLPNDELRRILAEEVAPAFGPNLLGVAGQWGMWHEEDVRDIVTRSNNGFAPLRALRRWMLRRYVAQEWEKLRPLLGA